MGGVQNDQCEGSCDQGLRYALVAHVIPGSMRIIAVPLLISYRGPLDVFMSWPTRHGPCVLRRCNTPALAREAVRGII